MERARKFSDFTKELTQGKKRLVIAVDGPAGSGKTTFANALGNHLANCQVVNLDQIYNGWEDALTSSLAKNLLKWLIEPFYKDEEISHPVFDWHKNEYSETRFLGKPNYLVLEGVGAGNKEVLASLDYLVWIEADLNLGLDRVKRRDGEKVAENMPRWRELEAKWFLTHQTKESANLHVDGNPPVVIDQSKEFWPL